MLDIDFPFLLPSLIMETLKNMLFPLTLHTGALQDTLVCFMLPQTPAANVEPPMYGADTVNINSVQGHIKFSVLPISRLCRVCRA